MQGRYIGSCVGSERELCRPFPKATWQDPPGILTRLKMITVEPPSPCLVALPLLLSHCCGQQLGVFRCQLSGQKRFRQARCCSQAARINPQISGFHEDLPARSLSQWNQPVVLTQRHPSSPGEKKKLEKLKGLPEGGQREDGEQAGRGRGGQGRTGFCNHNLIFFVLCVCTHVPGCPAHVWGGHPLIPVVRSL